MPAGGAGAVALPKSTELSTVFDEDREDDADPRCPFPDAAAFAKLRSLTKLAFDFNKEDQFCLGRHSERFGALDGLG